MYIGQHYISLPAQYQDLEAVLYSICQILMSEIQQAESNAYTHVVVANDETKSALKVIFHEMLDELDTGMPMEEFDKIFDQRFPPKF